MRGKALVVGGRSALRARADRSCDGSVRQGHARQRHPERDRQLRPDPRLRGQRHVNGLGGRDVIRSGRGDDTSSGGDDRDHVFGGRGNDTVSGDAGNDRVHGGSGDDTVAGGDGDDRAGGGKGNDSVDGGEGNDNLFGGWGADTVSGGNGNDRLHALAPDRQADTLDCGDGQDVAWVRRSEKDTTTILNCESDQGRPRDHAGPGERRERRHRSAGRSNEHRSPVRYQTVTVRRPPGHPGVVIMHGARVKGSDHRGRRRHRTGDGAASDGGRIRRRRRRERRDRAGAPSLRAPGRLRARSDAPGRRRLEGDRAGTRRGDRDADRRRLRARHRARQDPCARDSAPTTTSSSRSR